jgi:hypothetical protein
MKAVVSFALLASALQAQISIPRVPKKASPQQQDDRSSTSKQVNQTGVVREVQDGAISIELADSRLLIFKTTVSTKFNDGLSLAALAPGDRVRIQGTQDAEAFLTATSVSRDATAAVDSRGDAASDADARPRAANTVARKPAAVDPEDDGPPVLKRGKPVLRKSASADEPAETASASPPPAPPDSRPADSSLKGARPVDEAYSVETVENRNLDPKKELLARAQAWALSFTDTLPNYVCQQFTTRYLRVPGSREWQAKDIVSANVVYENGKEDYRNIAINGKAINKKMEDLPGSWSTGEFGTTLRSLFHPGRRTEFTYVKQSQMNGVSTWVYDYTVAREYSDWRIMLGSQAIIPAYTGRVWIDAKTAGVMRIEMAAANIPQDFPLDQVEASNDYGLVRLATADQYLLPTHAETLSCERGSPICSRNTIEFRNYHKYTGDAVITFDK